jgi:hypothetical protein
MAIWPFIQTRARHIAGRFQDVGSDGRFRRILELKSYKTWVQTVLLEAKQREIEEARHYGIQDDQP